MGIFGKKTDWSHMSEDDMKKNSENANHGDRFRLELYEQNFLDIKQFMSSPNFKDEEIIDSTGPSQSGDLTIPSIYIIDNKFLCCSRDMAIHGIMLTVVSFGTKVAFCLETYGNPYIKYYDATKNSFYPFLVIERTQIRDFHVIENQKFKAVKPKSSQQFAKNLGPGFWGAAGGLIPSLIVRGIFSAVAKAQDETVEKVGTIFNLSYEINEQIKEVSIASEFHYSADFERFLNIHWKTNKPVAEKEPTTKAEREQRAAELLKIGDKVRIPRFFSYDYGHIIKKEAKHAVVKVITKDGTDQIENVEYLKLLKVQK
jgi:hypothetical protein